MSVEQYVGWLRCGYGDRGVSTQLEPGDERGELADDDACVIDRLANADSI
jgi:hypothetical protein